MKKLLVLLALCMVFSVVLVACETNPDTDPETTVGATEAPSETDAETTAPGTTETEPESTETEPGTTETEPSTTEPGSTDTEPEPEPEPEPVKVIAGKSWDSLVRVDGMVELADKVFASGVEYLTWENNAIAEIDHTIDALRLYGWVAFFTETEGTVGYSINGGDIIYIADSTWTAEEGVQAHVAANVAGGKSACRMKLDIATKNLPAGETTVAVYAKDPDGNIELMKEFKVVKTMPYVENAQSGFSIDNITLNGAPYVTEGKVVAEMKDKNNTVTVMFDQEKGTLGFRGWAAFAAAPAVEFGYYIGDDIVIVTDAAYLQERPDLAGAGIVNGAGYNITVSIADIPAGTHPVGVIAKLEDGTYVQFYSFYLRILPEVEDKNIILGTRDGDPFVGSETKFGQKIPLGEDFLKQVTINALATYDDGNVNTWTFKVWQWNTDYATTVAGTPLFEKSGENHANCTDFTVEIPVELLISGDIYYEVEYTSGAKSFTPWGSSTYPEGVESYVNGNFKANSFGAYIVVATEYKPVDPNAPIVVGDANYLQNVAGGDVTVESAVLSEDGSYVTITTPGGDPQFWLLPQGSGIKGVQYITIVYRTTVDGGQEFDGEFFIGSTAITGGADELKFEYINDGEWHVLVLDITAHATVENGLVNYIRYDFFAGSAGSIDLKEVALFSNIEAAYGYHGLEVPSVEPETPSVEPLTIDLSGKACSENSWEAAGYSTPIIKLGYNGVSALGDLDLTAYNTITIKYSYDGDNTRGDGRTPEQCFTDSSVTPIIGFTAIEKCFGYANVVNQDAIDVGIYTEIELSSGCWAGATRTAVIDISDLEYNGPCYLTVFNPWGTEIVVSEIVLA